VVSSLTGHPVGPGAERAVEPGDVGELPRLTEGVDLVGGLVRRHPYPSAEQRVVLVRELCGIALRECHHQCGDELVVATRIEERAQLPKDGPRRRGEPDGDGPEVERAGGEVARRLGHRSRHGTQSA
jgi:hypothetical protein